MIRVFILNGYMLKLEMMRRLLFFHLLFVTVLFSFVGCQSKKDVISITSINIDPYSNKNINLSTLIDEFHIIPLETTPDCFVGNVDKIRFIKDRIYVFEEFGSQRLLCFSNDGKFLHQVGRAGKAAGEYITPRDFIVNPYSNRVELYDIASNRMLYYDTNGNYMASNSIRRKLRGITLIDSLHYGCFNDGEYEDLPYNFFVSPVDEFDVQNVSLPFLGQRDVMNDLNPFSHNGSSTLFAYSLNDTIYNVSPNGAEPKFVVNYMGERIPDALLREGQMQDIVEFIQKNRVPSFISHLSETDSFITFSYRYDFTAYNTVFYKKKDGAVINIYNPQNDINYLPFSPPVCVFNNSFVSVVPAFEVVSIYSELTEIKKNSPDKVNSLVYDKLEEIALNLKEDSNPILMVYTLRD